jgi:hypothetical protein
MKQLVIHEVYDIINSSSQKMLTMTLVHFTSSRVGTYRILYTWGRQVWAATDGVVNLDTVILNLSYQPSTRGRDTSSHRCLV